MRKITGNKQEKTEISDSMFMEEKDMVAHLLKYINIQILL